MTRFETIETLKRLGLPPLPVAPAQPADQYPARDKAGQIKLDKYGNPLPAFTGKNPSYLDSKGVPHLVNHRLYQDRLPTAAELKKWFVNPSTGIGTLGGWGDIHWIDLDRKQFESQEECDTAFAGILERLPGDTWVEQTHSGGYRIAARLAESPAFTNFALEPGGKHVGEVLGAGRFTVLAPTVGPSGKPYVRLSDGDPVEVESLEAIGIYSTRKTTERQQPAQQPRPVRVATAGVIDLADLLTGDCRSILEGSDTEGDRSASLTKLIKEAAGWVNWCSLQGFGVGGTVEALAAEAGAALGIDADRVERILKTVDLGSCQPAAQICGGDGSCWLKVKRLDRATWQRFGPERRQQSTASATAEGEEAEQKPSKLAANIRKFGAVFGNRLRFNQMAGFYEFDGKQTTVEELQITLALDFDLDTPRNFDLVVKAIAKPYDPVREYLEGCYARYGEETIDILSGITGRYFGNNKDIAQIQLRKWLIGAARRVFEPGTKLDNVLILHGKQGFNKSSFFKVLSNGFFDDSIGSATDKDERLKLHRNWIHEWGELESVFRRKDISAVKSFLTTQIDYLRPPYGRETVAMARKCAIVGSTNQDEFLADATGNRRFWVVPVKKRIDLQLLEQERDQIWAAAVALHFRGEPHWLDLETEAAAAAATAAYENSDPWEGAILDYLDGAGWSETAVEDLLQIVLKIELKDLDRGKQMRAADILKRAGWSRTDRRETRNGKRVRIWVRAEDCEIEPDYNPTPRPDFEVGDHVVLPDGRTGEIIEASESGFAVQNGKPEPERFEVGQLRLAVGTVVRHSRRGELGQIAGHYPDGYRVNSETWSEVLTESEFEVWRAVPSQAEG